MLKQIGETGSEAATGIAADAVRMQRAEGRGRLSTKLSAGRTRIDRLFQEGCAKIRLPRTFDGNGLEAVLINTSGGLTGGDRLSWEIEGAANTSTVVTTQACEKIYKSSGGTASVDTRIKIGENARLAWLPQETILYDRSALTRKLTIELAEGAEALIVECVIFGRQAMGETVRNAVLRDRWRISMAGKPIHAEDLAFGPDVDAMLARTSVTGGDIAIASLLWLHGDAEEHVDRVRAIAGDRAAVSGWRVRSAPATGKLLARFVAGNGYLLRRQVLPVIELLNRQAGVPKVWSI